MIRAPSLAIGERHDVLVEAAIGGSADQLDHRSVCAYLDAEHGALLTDARRWVPSWGESVQTCVARQARYVL